MFYKCLKYDLKCGLLKEYKKYIVAIGLFLIIGFDFFIKMSDIEITVPDYLFYLFFGMEEYVPSPGNKFRFPALWVAVILYVSYITLYYPYKDLNGYGKNILLNTQSKKTWYLSKCTWVTVSTIIYFLIGFVVLSLFAIISGAEITADVSSKVVLKFIPFITTQQNLFYNDAMYYKVTILHFVLPVIICVMNNLLQLFLSLFIKPFFSFIFTVSYTIASAYYLKSFMLGNYAMIARSNIFIDNGVNFTDGLIISLGVILVVIISGTILFSKQDILNKEGA